MSQALGIGAAAAAPTGTAWSPSVHLSLLLVGSCLNALAHDSLAALMFGPLVLTVALLPVALWGRWVGAPAAVTAAFTRVFSVGWFMAGVAAGYARWLLDPYQLDSDAFTFFQLASGTASGLGLEDIRAISEGAGAVLLWRSWYDLMASLGVEKARFVGVGLNTLTVATSAALALCIARLMFGADARREARLVLMFSACGLFWLFSAIHLRDSVVLLAVTCTLYFWVWYLRRGGVLRLLWLALAMAVMTAAFAVLRAEFAFVPLVTTVLALTAMVLETSAISHSARRWVALTVLALGAAFAWGYVVLALEAAGTGSETYRGLVEGEASQASLGARLIVGQPAPIRAVLGSIYLLIFPIPVWAGLVGDSALHLFKSLNAWFFYAMLPLAGVALGILWRDPRQRSADRLFVLLLALVFVGAIAMTSLETRHMGSFLVAWMLLALIPDPRSAEHSRRYRTGLLMLLCAMSVLHVAWAAVKLLN